MATPLSPRPLRLKPAEPTQQLLIFEVQREPFALPIQLVQKVIVVDRLYAALPGAATRLVMYQDQEIPVIDLERRIFGDRLASADSSAPPEESPPRHLLLVGSPQGETIGLPVGSAPTLRRVAQSAFKPLSSTFQTTGSIRCVSGLIVPMKDATPIFLLNLVQLLQPPALLPPMT